MCVDRRGQYAGSWFLFDRDQLPLDDAMWSGAIDVALRAASHLQSFGYFGPLGIDAMSYRDFEGELRIRPLQDLNARWTMGRLSLDLRRIAQSAKYGLWQHGPVESFRDDIPFEVNRVISTSPRQVAEQRCQHASRIVIST